MTMEHEHEPSDLTADEQEVVGDPGDLVTEDAVAPRPRASSVMVSIRIDRRTFDALSTLAEHRGGTFSDTIRDALRGFLEGQRAAGSYPEAGASRGSRRVSEQSTRTWHDEGLRAELLRYEAACRRAGMRDSAWRSYVDYARRFLAWREGDYWPRGMAAGDRPVPRTAATTDDLRTQAKRYGHMVELAGREQPTVQTYVRHAMFFIRWLDGDFEPGARLRGIE
jgi:hypothetical protein